MHTVITLLANDLGPSLKSGLGSIGYGLAAIGPGIGIGMIVSLVRGSITVNAAAVYSLNARTEAFRSAYFSSQQQMGVSISLSRIRRYHG